MFLPCMFFGHACSIRGVLIHWESGLAAYTSESGVNCRVDMLCRAASGCGAALAGLLYAGPPRSAGTKTNTPHATLLHDLNCAFLIEKMNSAQKNIGVCQEPSPGAKPVKNLRNEHNAPGHSRAFNQTLFWILLKNFCTSPSEQQKF